MEPLVAFWHIVGFFAPAVVTGFVAAALTKLVWRRRLAGVAWWRLGAAAAAAMAAASIASLVVWAQDGRMLGYMAMVLAGSAAIWWRGFRP